MRRAHLLLLLVSLASCCAAAQTAAPVLFYTDIESGPATGGEGGTNGAFVCLYGEHFGISRGSSKVTVGGTTAAAYKRWHDPGSPYVPGYFAKACVQLAAATPSGAQSIQMTTAGGVSNPLPFTVRPGRILWVSKTGSDAKGNGSHASPFATPSKCKYALHPGDICILGTSSLSHLTFGVGTLSDGVTRDTASIGLRLDSSGISGEPKAIVVYPGASVAIDTHSIVKGGIYDGWTAPKDGRGLESYLDGADVSYWTIAGLSFNADSMAVDLTRGGNLRLVDNDFECTGVKCDYGPNAYGGGVLTAGSSATGDCGAGSVCYLYFYGDRIHNVGHPTPPNTITNKEYQNVYFSTNTDHVWFGWNSVDGNGKACRGIQFYNTTDTGGAGTGQYDLHVFDNVIHNTVCDGINFATVDPSQGIVEAYNNVIYAAGTGPTGSNEANYACIYSPGSATGSASGSIAVYNNTLYNCGSLVLSGANSSAGAIGVIPSSGSPNLYALVSNNIIDSAYAEEAYVEPHSGSFCTATTAYCASDSTSNVFYGSAGSPPAWDNNILLDPQFVAPGLNFHLESASPIAGLGSPSLTSAADLDGQVRSSSNPTPGAYELVPASISAAARLKP
jgi:hypothetical protein